MNEKQGVREMGPAEPRLKDLDYRREKLWIL